MKKSAAKKPSKKKASSSAKIAKVKKHLKSDMKMFDKEKKEDKELMGALSARFSKGR